MRTVNTVVRMKENRRHADSLHGSIYLLDAARDKGRLLIEHVYLRIALVPPAGAPRSEGSLFLIAPLDQFLILDAANPEGRLAPNGLCVICWENLGIVLKRCTVLSCTAHRPSDSNRNKTVKYNLTTRQV
jgi:hypothetical protein